MRKPLLVVLAALLLSACSTGVTAPPKIEPPDPGPPVADTFPPRRPPSAPSPASALFPASDQAVEIKRSQRGQLVDIEELRLRDGDRIATFRDGQPEAVWYIRPDGVWRLDPWGGGNWLRYLPAELLPGLSWRQQSGKSSVSFHLTQLQPQECAFGDQATSGDCWELTLHGAGQMHVHRFSSGLGLISTSMATWARPEESQVAMLAADRPLEMTGEQRKELLERIPHSSKTPEAPVAISSEEFWAALGKSVSGSAAGPVSQYDFDGDGRKDLVWGAVGEWSTDPILFLGADGQLMYRAAPLILSEPGHRVTPLRFPNSKRTVFLYELRRDHRAPELTLLAHQVFDSPTLWPVYGWQGNSLSIAADRYKVSGDRIMVEQEMHDPLKHVRVRTYLYTEAGGGPALRPASDRIISAGGESLYPETPQDVLQSAFNARWWNLTSEIGQFFANGDAAERFATNSDIRENPGGGTVLVGKFDPDAEPSCGPQLLPAGDPTQFVARWGGEKWCRSVWGSVSFAKSPDGRIMIESLQIEGKFEHAE